VRAAIFLGWQIQGAQTRDQKDNKVGGTKTKQRPQAGVQRLQLQFGSSQQDNAVRGFYPLFPARRSKFCLHLPLRKEPAF